VAEVELLKAAARQKLATGQETGRNHRRSDTDVHSADSSGSHLGWAGIVRQMPAGIRDSPGQTANPGARPADR
jgi:hypothetical protein